MTSPAVGAHRHCVACGEPYGRTAIPRWAFDTAGRLVGTVHTSHAKGYLTSADEHVSVETARFTVWLMLIEPRPPYGSDADYAVSLGISEEPHWPLSESQEKRLQWWVDPSGLAFDDARLASIREHYRSLIERYQQWRAGIHDLPLGQRESSPERRITP